MSENSEYPLALPVGAELVGDYVITKILGAGGFGITYEAKERSLDRMVAIKEFFPVDIVERDGWALVKARSRDLDMKYARGLRRFIEEAKAITQFNHPNIVKVLRYFKTNNTAFMVLHYEQGLDFDLWQRQLQQRLTEEQLKAIILPLLDALSAIHASDFLHRDIAPDNIIIRKDGSPVLIDFGSARSELTFNEKTVSALVKSGYSPFEQYAKSSKEQGPWTDIYSFGATLYQAVTRTAPADSLSRLATDELVPAAKLAKKYYSQPFLKAIDQALALKISERPQTVEIWRDMLFPPAADAQPDGEGLTVMPPAQKRANPLQGLAEKAAGLPGNMARAAARAKENLRPQTPAQQHPPTPAPPTDDNSKPERKHRSLMSLLNEVEQDDSVRENEQKIANAAQGGFSPAEALQHMTPRVSKTRVAALKERMRNLLVPVTKRRKPLLALALAGGLAGGAYHYRADILDYADDIDFAFNLKLPSFSAPSNPFSSKGTRSLSAGDGGVKLLFQTNDGGQLISTGSSNMLKIWSLADNRLLTRLTPQQRPITALDRRDEVLLLGDESGMVTLYDQRENKKIVSFQAHQGAISSLSFTGREFDFVVGGVGGKLNFWDYNKGKFTQGAFRGRDHKGDITSIATNNSYVITTSTDNTAKLWGRLRRRSLVRTYRGHDAGLRAVAIAPNARRFATASEDGTVKIWSNRSRRVRRTLRGHAGAVLAVAYSPDSRWVASGGVDKQVRLWNPRSGKLRRAFDGHSGPVRAVLFSQDGKRLISAGDDGSIRIWDIESGKPSAKK